MKVKEIVLDIKGQEVKVTVEEAKVLYDELRKLFTTVVTYTHPYDPYPSWPVTNPPVVTYADGDTTTNVSDEYKLDTNKLASYGTTGYLKSKGVY